MSNLDDRKRAIEHKFAHDAELEFKSIARRNKLVGLWAAAKLGKTGDEAAAYAKEIVMAGLEANGEKEVVDKLLSDFGRAGISVPVADIEKQMVDQLPVARKQLTENQ